MDKYEYKIKSEEIRQLLAEGDFVQAAEIADTIDWRRVRNVKTLCVISDLYKANRRYEDARDLLLMAREYRPGARNICFALCELSLKTEEFVQAVEYYKEFVLVAPKDSGRYILQYKLYEAQDVSLEERIEVLEELKKHDYREKWAYELAYLYHRVGLATRCVEECDELISMLGEGKYVIKAMELKMLHQPLSPDQQAVYDHRFDGLGIPVPQHAEREAQQPVPEREAGNQQAYSQEEEVVLVKRDTQVYKPVRTPAQDEAEEPAETEETEQAEPENAAAEAAPEEAVPEEAAPEAIVPETVPVAEDPDELDIQVKTVDVGEYNTINLQAELAQGLREVLGAEHQEPAVSDPITQSIVAPMMETDTKLPELPEDLEPTAEQPEEPAAELPEAAGEIIAELSEEIEEAAEAEESVESAAVRQAAEVVRPSETTTATEFPQSQVEEIESSEVFFGETGEIENVEKMLPDRTGELVMEQLRMEKETIPAEVQAVITAEPPKEMAHVLAQESDGQISLVVPDNQSVERQITGQMNIMDIMAEWERIKQENAEKRKEELRQHVLQETGRLFSAFDAAAKDGLLEQLEKKAAEEVALGIDEPVEEMLEADEELLESDEVEELEDAVEVPDDIEETLDAEAEEFGEPEYEEEFEETDDEFAEEVAEDETAAEEAEVEDEFAEEVAEDETAAEEAEVEDEFAEEAVEDEVAADETELADETAVAAAENEETAENEAAAEEAESEDEFAEAATESEVDEAEAEVEDEFTEEAAENEAEAGETELADEPAKPATEPNAEPEAENTAKADSESKESKSATESKPETKRTVEAEAAKADSADSGSKVRPMTPEERELYAPFVQSKSAREQIVKAIDGISLAAYTGNVIITGEEGMDTLSLAKNMMKEVQSTDSNFSGKIAKISGKVLNKKDLNDVVKQLQNGALIIEKASDINETTTQALYKILQKEDLGIVIVMEDNRKVMNSFLRENEQLLNVFTVRVDVEALSNDTLVAYGRQYAQEREYAIDELGVLALHTRIEEKQTIDHAVTAPEVKSMVDAAIEHANRKNMKHFFDILTFRRYDENDMIVLTEKDFA